MSDYPDAIDSFTTKANDDDFNDAADINDLQDSIVAVQTALGTNPEGSEADVAARLTAIEEGGGTGGGATPALDNLAAVAVNASLVPGTDASISLGSAIKKWLEGFFSRLTFKEGGSTNTPSSGDVALYAKADGLLYSKDDAGTETLLSGGSIAGKSSVALDNLSSVAINTSLISDTDNTDDLGSAAKKWKEYFTYRGTFKEGGPTTTPASGDVALYAKADGLLYSKDDAGLEKLVSAGTGNYVLNIGSIADVSAEGIITTLTVDTNAQGVGAPLAMAADGNLDTADADSVNNMPCVALAIETGTGSKKVLLHGVLRNDAWNWTMGAGAANLIYVSTTVGTLTQTKPIGADNVVQPVGWALSADKIFFAPSMLWITHTG